VNSLNDYLFSILKPAPNPESAGLHKFEVFFEYIYFALSGQEPVIEKFSFGKARKTGIVKKNQTQLETAKDQKLINRFHF
jgi:hypothetical protein